MGPKRLLKQNVRTVVGEDGITKGAEEYEEFLVGREPDFVKMYIKDIGKLMDLNKSDDKVLFCLLRSMDYSNTVVVDIYTKTKIMEELSMPINTINASIKNLHNAGILSRVIHGRYQVNPDLFAKGSWKNIQTIKMEIEYSSKGKTIKQVEIKNNHINILSEKDTDSDSKFVLSNDVKVSEDFLNVYEQLK